VPRKMHFFALGFRLLSMNDSWCRAKKNKRGESNRSGENHSAHWRDFPAARLKPLCL